MAVVAGLVGLLTAMAFTLYIFVEKSRVNGNPCGLGDGGGGGDLSTCEQLVALFVLFLLGALLASPAGIAMGLITVARVKRTQTRGATRYLGHLAIALGVLGLADVAVLLVRRW